MNRTSLPSAREMRDLACRSWGQPSDNALDPRAAQIKTRAARWDRTTSFLLQFGHASRAERLAHKAVALRRAVKQ